MGTKNKKSNSGNDPRPAYRVFISSSFEDMKEFRLAAQQAMTNVEAVPKGMERFTASTEPVIDRCYDEIKECQFFVSIVGFRYGSLYPNTNLSYSELEFNKAEEEGIPILVFIQEGTIDADSIDMEDFNRLQMYKKRLKNSGSKRMVTTFRTVEELREKLTIALRDEFDRKAKQSDKECEPTVLSDDEEHLKGAAIFKKFLLMPAVYDGHKVKLRVRFDGYFGSWRLKEELFEAFDMKIGRAIYFNDLFVLGVDYTDMGDEAKHIDCFADEKTAKWILDNHITKGSVFEGTFTLMWRYAKNIAGKSRIQIGANDAYIAKLILRDSDLKLIAQGNNSQSPSRSEDGSNSQESIFNLLGKLI